jgi:tryptophan synthase alpha chain
VALEQGITVSKCLELVAGLRQRQVTQPLFLMGYYNPILAYGVTRYVDQAQAAGADGFIVPDLPPEEANEMEAACRQNNCALVYLLAPTSPIDRARQIAARTTGFLYLVSLTGVTGARKTLPSDLAGFIQETRQVARTPIAVGFGISTPEQAASVGSLADGVIVGSALIDVVTHSQQPCHAASGFISALRSALQE